MALTVMGNDPITAPEDERAALARFAELLGAGEYRDIGLVDDEGRSSPLPATALRVLQEVTEILARGEGAVVASVGPEVTPSQAAELLALPRHYIEELLDAGAIPARGEGAVRRIALTDLLVYRRDEDARREAAMSELVRTSEKLGLYRHDIPTPARHE